MQRWCHKDERAVKNCGLCGASTDGTTGTLPNFTTPLIVYPLRASVPSLKQHSEQPVKSIWSAEGLNIRCIVGHVAQEYSARINRVSILTGTIKLRFSHICSSVLPYPNGTKFAAKLASTQHISNLKKIPQAIPEIGVNKFL